MKSDLRILLVKPSKYDDEGYVVHHLRGVLPSNTLYTLNALFKEAVARNGRKISIQLFDETVGLIEPARIIRKILRHGTGPVLACLVGVQTNQIPRALDLARQFREYGTMVLLGGFHISGIYSQFGCNTELDNLLASGFSLFVGEAEGRIDEVLHDAISRKLKPLYIPESLPNLQENWPIPVVDQSLAKNFFLPNAGTLDTSRGCIFNCSFCTVIQVQGRGMRSRSTDAIERHITANYKNQNCYFFTDDNMARNRSWRDLFERLIGLRQKGMPVKFMMQVDVAAHKLPLFVELASQAGCSQVFIGLESLNQKNLDAASKLQNKVENFKDMVAAWRSAQIAVHTAYIIGFPHDCPASVRRDMETLRDEIQPDQASFFMLTPLPGSSDHRKLIESGAEISPDYNQYDSFHPTTQHAHMSADEWSDVYKSAWKDFYSKENLIRILMRTAPKRYWDVFKTALWYSYALHCERLHPMISGFWRLKGRKQRRSGFKRQRHFAYSFKRAMESVQLLLRILALTKLFEQVWRETWLEKRKQELGSRLQKFACPHQATLLRVSAWGLRKITTISLRMQRYKPLRPCTSILTARWLFLCNLTLEI